MALASKTRLHNGGYSIIERWVGSQVPGDAVRVGGRGSQSFAQLNQNGSIEAPSLFLLILQAAMKVNGTTDPAAISGQNFNTDELMGNLVNLPLGCLRSVVVDAVLGYCSSINFQNNGAAAPLYVDFEMAGVSVSANITLDFQHSIIQ
jgi:hypothetical protein